MSKTFSTDAAGVITISETIVDAATKQPAVSAATGEVQKRAWSFAPGSLELVKRQFAAEIAAGELVIPQGTS